MKNNKAVSITEVLVVIAIMGILAGLIVPQVTNYIESSKKKSYLTTVASFGEYIELSHPKELSKENSIKVYSFEDLNMEKGDNKESPYGVFDQTKSFVVIFCTNKCTTYIQALDDQNKGIKLTNLDELTSQKVITITEEDILFTKDEPDIISGFLNRVGDINRDGTINAFDLTALKNHLSGTTTLSENLLDYADVNLDKTLDENDTTVLENYLNNNIKVLPYKK